MNNIIEWIKTFFERRAFGVCEWMGDWMLIRSANIRLFFIYASFLTIGSPIIIYLIMAFVRDLKKLMRQQRGSVWDL
jgi:phage shock protein C